MENSGFTSSQQKKDNLTEADLIKMMEELRAENTSYRGVYLGMPIITSSLLTVTKPIKRTWRERLFTRPWRPLVRFRYITVPSDKIYIVEIAPSALAGGRSQLIGHPITIEKLRHLIAVGQDPKSMIEDRR